MKTSKTICLFSMPRCGSNHFCDLMWNLENIDVNAEIFHPKAFYGNTDIVNKLSFKYKINNLDFEETRIKLAQIRFNDSVGFYKNLRKTIDEKCVFFKVFDHVLNEEEGNGEKLFQFILNDVDIGILLKRNLIDAYISEKKAQKKGAYDFCDTTNIKIKFRKKEYLLLKKRYNEFFEFVKLEFQKQNKLLNIINFEEFIKSTDAGKLNHLSNVTKLKIKEKTCLKHSKQDKTINIEEKIINFKEHREFIYKEL